MGKIKITVVLALLLTGVLAFQNCSQFSSVNLSTASSTNRECIPASNLSTSALSTESWFMEEVLENRAFTVENSTLEIANEHWAHDSINGAHIGVNGWALGAGLIPDAHVLWEIEDDSNELALQWFMGGYNRDYGGRPQDGWYFNNLRGGNNVKAYPRMAIGTASGQPNASWGAPNVPSTTTNGIQHVNYNMIQEEVGIPARYENAPNIDINVNLSFSMGSNEVSARDRYGNFFFAVDSYFQAGTLNGITDTSGQAYNTVYPVRGVSTKRWAMMIWYSKTAYYETSGGIELANNVMIGDIPHIVKYKLEGASDINFHYAAFIMDREVEELTSSTQQPTVRYNDYADFLTSGDYQTLLNNYMDINGPLEDLDGISRRITAPTGRSVLSDVNIGVEILSNPDTPQNTAQHPVRINFKDLSFNVEGKGVFGHGGGGNSSQPQSRGLASEVTICQ